MSKELPLNKTQVETLSGCIEERVREWVEELCLEPLDSEDVPGLVESVIDSIQGYLVESKQSVNALDHDFEYEISSISVRLGLMRETMDRVSHDLKAIIKKHGIM